jgi:hypothetical protein
MNYGEYWLLETAVECGVPLPLAYGWPDNMREFWNKPFHGMRRDETADTFLRLFADGDIYATNRIDPRTGEEGEQRRRHSSLPDRDEIITQLGASKRTRPEKQIVYWLTEQGGDRWAAHTHADWDRYYEYEFRDFRQGEEQILDGEPVGRMSVRTAHRARLDFLIHTLWRWWPHHECHGDRIEISEVAPWQATYWKTLPRAYQAELSTLYIDPNVRDAPQRVLDLVRGMSKEQIAEWAKREQREIWHWHDGFCGDAPA